MAPTRRYVEDAGAQSVVRLGDRDQRRPRQRVRPGRRLQSSATTTTPGSPSSRRSPPTGTLTYTPAGNANGSATVSVQIHDNGGVLNGGVDTSAVQTFTITVTPVNDAPTATNLSAAETYVEDTTLNLVNIVASDVDSATVTATLTLSNTAAGSLTTATSGAVTSTYVPGTGVWTASGAIADVNTLLAGVSFVPAPNFNANFTIATSVSDGALSVTGSKAVTGTPVNDAPSVHQGSPTRRTSRTRRSKRRSGWATVDQRGPRQRVRPGRRLHRSAGNNNTLFTVAAGGHPDRHP